MLVVVDWLFMVSSDVLCAEAVCSGTVSSGIDISRIRIESLLVVVAISEFGVCCGGHYVITSSKAISDVICEVDIYSGSSPE